MAFPFSMFNIAHLAAGFKSQMDIYKSKTVILPVKEMCAILRIWETIEPKAALPLFFSEGLKALQTKERRAMQCMLHIRI